MIKIEFLFFDSCPSYVQALENLKEALTEQNLEYELDLIRVNSPEEAEKFDFQGSPSIRVNGIDLEGRKGEASFNCRIYTINGKMSGVPSKHYIKENLSGFIYKRI